MRTWWALSCSGEGGAGSSSCQSRPVWPAACTPRTPRSGQGMAQWPRWRGGKESRSPRQAQHPGQSRRHQRQLRPCPALRAGAGGTPCTRPPPDTSNCLWEAGVKRAEVWQGCEESLCHLLPLLCVRRRHARSPLANHGQRPLPGSKGRTPSIVTVPRESASPGLGRTLNRTWPPRWERPAPTATLPDRKSGPRRSRAGHVVLVVPSWLGLGSGEGHAPLLPRAGVRRHVEPVADLADGLDERRPRGVRLDLAPQGVDAAVHAPRGDEDAVAPDRR